MIRRSLRRGVRLGLLAGIALALFKLVQGRRATDLGTPSDGWATPPPPPPTPGTGPEPVLVTPVMLEEVIEKKKAVEPSDDVPAAPVPSPALVPPAAGASVVKKSSPVKRAAPAKNAAEAAAEVLARTGGTVPVPVAPAAPEKVAGAPEPAAPQPEAPVQDAPVAKEAAPAKKPAPKKAQ